MMDDLISRQAAIDAVEKAVTKEAARWSIKELPPAQPEPITVYIDHELTREEYKKLREDVANAPIMLRPAAQPEQQWIPCKLKNQYYIPELNGCKDKPYLVTYETATGKRYVTKTNIHNGRVQRKENRIVAWMPLPEPYKGEEL